MVPVVVERYFPEATSIESLTVAVRNADGCLARHNTRYFYGYVAPDRQRMICLFEAPDAESVRLVSRQTGMPFERIYPVTVHEPPAATPTRSDTSAATDVLVERSFPEPVVFAEVQAIEDGGAWCLSEHGVTWVRTYFSTDRRRMLCRYRAADTESVRIVNRRLGLPFDVAWPITHFAPGE
jgi:hypothetical protein